MSSSFEMRPDLRAWIEIDLDAVRANVTAIRKTLQAHTQILAVVKADAYGHGLVRIALEALKAGASGVGTATVAEAIALREAGVSASIVILCVTMPATAVDIVAYRLTPIVGDPAMLAALASAARRHAHTNAAPEIHLEIDTGMGRSGVLPLEAVAFWQEAMASGLTVNGLTTHFVDADGPDGAMTLEQEQLFVRTWRALEAAGARFAQIHLSNSAATLRFPTAHGTLVRPGLLLYGIRPPNPASLSTPLDLQSVLSLKARVASVRNLPAGHTISYGATYRMPRPGRVATVLIGYGDGFPRRLSHQGAVLLQGRRAPILGRVCMDQTVVDVTDIPAVAPGDVAVCIGPQERERITVEEIAAQIDTTEHEITTCLTARLPRFHLRREP